MDLSPVIGILRVALPVVGDARAAGESNPAVDDERLPVGPVVEAANRIPAHRVVPGELATAGLECLQDFGANRRRPHGIEQELDGDAGAPAIRERARELEADLTVPVDVALDGDRHLRLADGIEHGRIELVPVVEQRDRVAGRELDPRQPADGTDELRVVHAELMIQPVLRRTFGRRQQETDERREPGPSGPPPVVRDGGGDGDDRPDPPRQEEAADPQPQSNAAVRYLRVELRRELRAPFARYGSTTGTMARHEYIAIISIVQAGVGVRLPRDMTRRRFDLFRTAAAAATLTFTLAATIAGLGDFPARDAACSHPGCAVSQSAFAAATCLFGTGM